MDESSRGSNTADDVDVEEVGCKGSPRPSDDHCDVRERTLPTGSAYSGEALLAKEPDSKKKREDFYNFCAASSKLKHG